MIKFDPTEYMLKPYSIQMNFFPSQRAEITILMRNKITLSDKEKENVKEALKIGRETYLSNPGDNGYVTFPGGWQCRSLKDYLKHAGYHLQPCGNEFDLNVSVDKIPE